MSSSNDAVTEIVRKWSKEIPSINYDFWERTRSFVSPIMQLHSPKTSLNLVTRMRAATQCLKSIQYAICYLERLSESSVSRRSTIEFMVKVLEEVVLLLASLLKPCNPGLASQLCDFPVVKRIVFLSTVECESLKLAAIEALRNFIDDRPEIVDAVLRMSREQMGCDITDSCSISPPIPKKNLMLEFLMMATIGSRIPPGLCQRTQLVLPGPDSSLSAPSLLHHILTADILPVLVSLLNAPWRDRHQSWLILGACPESKRLRGIMMNFDDQDSFRLGFDQHVLDRLHPQPTADIIRLRIIRLTCSEEIGNEEANVSQDRRERVERQQRERVPCIIAIEVGQILIEEGFSYCDRDKTSNHRRYVTITMQPSIVKLNANEETRKSAPNLSVKERLSIQIAQLDRQLADVKKRKKK